MSLLQHYLDNAIEASKNAPAGLWEAFEDTLTENLCFNLVDALMQASIWQEAEKELLAEILATREFHPILVREAITDACDRLNEKGLLTEELKAARDHVFDFAASRQEKLAARRAAQSDSDNEIDDLMRRLRECGFC